MKLIHIVPSQAQRQAIQMNVTIPMILSVMLIFLRALFGVDTPITGFKASTRGFPLPTVAVADIRGLAAADSKRSAQ